MGNIIYLGSAKPSSGSGGGSVSVDWGDIGGELGNQTDLATVLGMKIANDATGTGALTILGDTGLGPYGINIGADSHNTYNGVAIGHSAVTYGGSDIAIGANTTSNLGGAIVVGYKATSFNENTVTIGNGAINGSNDIADDATESIAIGKDASNMYSNSIALGSAATTTADKQFMVGFGLDQNNTAINYVLLDGTSGKIPSERLNPVEIIANQNTNTGAISPLKVWNGTEQEWNNGGSQTWYGWDSISPLGTTTYYLESSSPQQGDIVYSAPNVATTGTVQTIMSSTMVSTTNGMVLQYNASHNQTAQGNLGREHPDWLFNIDGVGVKLGTTDIANYITYTAGNNVSINNGVISATNTTYTAGNNISISNNVISATNTTYSPFTGATSSTAGSAGLVPYPTTADVGKYLKGDGTWASVSVSEITNQNTNIGAVTPLKIWNGTEQEWNNGGSQTWYCWDEFQGGVGKVGTWYTLDDPENITTETVLYSAPNVVDTSVTVTGPGYRSFPASNGNTGMYNSSGNQTTSISIGESHPDWLCFINGVGVKIGTTTIAQVNAS